MRIGITEHGDGGIDLSWAGKMDRVDAIIVVSKNITLPKFQEKLLEYSDRAILHATITCMGGTKVEPNVPKALASLEALSRIVDQGFPPEQIALRVDPIFSVKQLEQRASGISFNELADGAKKLGISRLRFSFADFYPHVKKRFLDAGISRESWPELDFGGFHMSMRQRRTILDKLVQVKGMALESCGENAVPGYPQVEKLGCVSIKDLEILGIADRYDPNEKGRPAQRDSCGCLPAKTEMLDPKKKEPCAHHCLYCFWKDKPETKPAPFRTVR